MTSEERGTAKIAYFSMEIALDPSIPTYSGGLGILAGDTLRSAADAELPMVAITLVYRKGYFRQRLDARGCQTEEPDSWGPDTRLVLEGATTAVQIEGRQVQVRAWRYDVVGISGHRVPVYLLDADLPANSDWDRTLTDTIYGGDAHYRLCQEIVLGIGGVGMLRALGFEKLDSYHMNEGHSAFLMVALLEEQLQMRQSHDPSEADVEAVRRQCVFTTHTPVPAGHDKFPWDMVTRVLGSDRADLLIHTRCCTEEGLNMTFLALGAAHYVNGVAMRHEEVSQGMFPHYPIHAITNGVHALTWTSPSFQELYDQHIPEWRHDNDYLRYAVGIPRALIQKAHFGAKAALMEEVRKRTGVALDESAFTIGFARRAATYKRAGLLFSDLDRLRRIAKRAGLFQVIYGGKAHPRDSEGKAVIRQIFEAAAQLKNEIQVVYLENYDMTLARLMTSGVDLWLNTPQPPYEASGTSGMKAALNGVPSLSVLDGWWVEGCFEGSTGWAIGSDLPPGREGDVSQATSLYRKLEEIIIPMFYNRPAEYARVMRSAIAVNGSFFNTQRMLYQYENNAYYPGTLAKAVHAAT
ncbi:MAG: alpha-glucan family phosphorylase [Terriglobia bacterium]|jgi:starch phosphorylase